MGAKKKVSTFHDDQVIYKKGLMPDREKKPEALPAEYFNIQNYLSKRKKVDD